MTHCLSYQGESVSGKCIYGSREKFAHSEEVLPTHRQISSHARPKLRAYLVNSRNSREGVIGECGCSQSARKHAARMFFSVRGTQATTRAELATATTCCVYWENQPTQSSWRRQHHHPPRLQCRLFTQRTSYIKIVNPQNDYSVCARDAC